MITSWNLTGLSYDAPVSANVSLRYMPVDDPILDPSID